MSSAQSLAQVRPRTAGPLSCLEHRADSSSIVVFLHGLGLDARDFVDYLAHHEAQHAIAVTLHGFDPGPQQAFPPVALSTHIAMTADALAAVAAENPGKRIVLVGFSLGADLVLQLAEFWAEHRSRAVPIESAVLLDPNVNQSTMMISRLFAAADPADPNPTFERLRETAQDPDAERALAEYLSKIGSKDFAQLQQLSRDVLAYWPAGGYRRLGERLATVADFAATTRVFLSAPYAEHLPGMTAAVPSPAATTVSFELTALDHFGLISNESLSAFLSHAL
ncbi:alpha/beta fold hydrolase [Kitasatospora griseola]|uniref:alpha/beta fold hydrolase n=1 Tax=Kitasatospora griseola TaxID=2064 RepID=UPI001671040C|nr:alpha/beta hydrolase [Kitasatospora griseola]GGQ94456.1 hypothetical protein GCM10010195_57880 [Kitasatospora griseola]